MIPAVYPDYVSALQAEVLDRLTAIAGVTFTGFDAEVIAAHLITPLANGTYLGSSHPTELLRLIDSFGLAAPAEPVTCPVSWCTGQPYEHGGDGRPESEYAHESASDCFAPNNMLHGEFAQAGNAIPFYRLDAEQPRDETLLTVSEVLALADSFELHAKLLRTRAVELRSYGGAQ